MSATTHLHLLVLAVVMIYGQGYVPLAQAQGTLNGIGANILSQGVQGHLGQLGNLASSLVDHRGVPETLNTAANMIAKPLEGALGTLTRGPIGNNAPQIGDQALNALSIPSGLVDGLTTGLGAATGLSPLTNMASGATNSMIGVANNAINGLTGANLLNPLAAARMRHQAPGFAGPLASPLAAANQLGQMRNDILPVSSNLESIAHNGFDTSVQDGVSRIINGPLASAPAIPENVGIQAANQLIGRQTLANEALGNAQAESAIAGADMVAHGANNARSASLASNAYRQAKLANARDRVNIAGTIQNTARISDAAIATHDAATKAEDSLLGSELAVDSAATVLDSDAAYIPPVTNSLLRSLPYGRLSLRNIVPRPLTYPSVLLPDVWLNGLPINYMNVPLRPLPFSPILPGLLQPNGQPLAGGLLANGQSFHSNNGILLNNMLVDPIQAYLFNGAVPGSSIFPILSEGQLAAHEELGAANFINNQQLAGPGMLSTYTGFGRTNPVPLLTGTVSNANIVPTTTIGTTYPVGSALIIEPRDSYFQDYIDNASSRQNYDEHQ